MNEETLFELARNTPEAERAALLERECADNPELRARVEALLRADGGTQAFNPKEAGSRTTAEHKTIGEAGQVIAGKYTLVEVIGEGGMGSVWRAKQTEPVKRFVAVKLIKAGMDSKTVLARFDAERQALALMDHPNIAKILDGGLHDNRPFFVMELVKGTPITEFCDVRKFTPQQRLELFLPVCNAIQHAHMKGIIHRDIKPNNVLIALYDDKPVPKVIDFGVAKATGGTLTEHTIDTGFGGVVGTPQYMSPEQATFNNLDIDTRSDVYALGVLLYELLAGSPPFSRPELQKVGLLEILRVIREEEPPRPSFKLSTAETKASISASRGTEPKQLTGLLRNELDWIVMKSLDKDRSRRYDTANAFAADVNRYLTGEAVQAHPPTLGYRLRKTYRRNKAAITVASAFIGVLMGATTVGAYLAVQAKRAEAMARSNELEAQEQRQEAERNKNAWLEVSNVYWEAAVEAEIRNAGSRLDADLLEYKSDKRLGLLRLARPLNDSISTPSIGPNFSGITYTTFAENPEFVKLREFQTAAVITAGQEFVPLVPPIGFVRDTVMLPPFGNVGPDETSPDGRFYLGHTDQIGLEMWSIPSLKRVGLLREARERVLRFGFTPDSKTIYTQDEDSIVRFWNTDGTFRAKTPLRPNRYIYPTGMSHKQVRFTAKYNHAIVANGMAVVWSQQRIGVTPGDKQSDWDGEPGPVSPSEMYSTRTGQLIRRLDRPGWKASDFQLTASNHWFIYQEAKDQVVEVVVVSADDGRELARLNLGVSKTSPNGARYFRVSPNHQWMTAWQRHYPNPGNDWVIDPKTFQLWRCHDWKLVQDSALTDAFAAMKKVLSVYFYTDDLVGLIENSGDEQPSGWVRIGQPGSWMAGKALWSIGFYSPVVELGGNLFREDRTLFTADPFQRLKPPVGRKYHSDLAKIAPDGRFWESLDTVTEKDLPFLPSGMAATFFPGYGRVGVRMSDDDAGWPGPLENPELHILPDPSKLSVQPEMLELWAQVVAGGELAPDGRFAPWDEPTWTAKQKQLAAMPPPYPDFPFPGWAATEPHLWWRIRANQLKESGEHDRLIAEWRRLTGRSRPDLGPDTWRTTGPIAELAPLPRVKK